MEMKLSQSGTKNKTKQNKTKNQKGYMEVQRKEFTLYLPQMSDA